ncbi:MAG: hypothetical protein IJF77_05700 [Alistipes sp.]|nr:hypothetical protein [Alistipes sp.]
MFFVFLFVLVLFLHPCLHAIAILLFILTLIRLRPPQKKSKKVRFLRLNARFHTACATPIDRIGLLVATAQNFAQKERNALQTNALRTFLLSISTHRGP